jgi:prepilin-type processing-associated H-X9-DG protein
VAGAPLTANRHSQGYDFSFADGHVEHWRWTGPYINGENAKFRANDTTTERSDPDVNLTNLSPSSRTDPDAIRLANALQTP